MLVSMVPNRLHRAVRGRGGEASAETAVAHESSRVVRVLRGVGVGVGVRVGMRVRVRVRGVVAALARRGGPGARGRVAPRLGAERPLPPRGRLVPLDHA
jgi:hypothetical protein